MLHPFVLRGDQCDPESQGLVTPCARVWQILRRSKPACAKTTTRIEEWWPKTCWRAASAGTCANRREYPEKEHSHRREGCLAYGGWYDAWDIRLGYHSRNFRYRPFHRH